MHRTMLCLLTLGWGLAAACSNTDDSNGGAPGTGGSSAAGQSSSDGGFGIGGSAPGGAGGVGGSDGREEVWVEAGNLMSCDDVCQEEGYQCAAVCGDNNSTAADTLYTYASSSGMNFNQQRQFAVCATPVSGVLAYNGNDYALVTLRCCCLALPVQRINGDPSQPVTCNAVCAAQGLVCHTETDWDSLATSGMMATYTTSTSVRYLPGDCDEVPALSVNRVGVDEPLTAYRCGCVSP